MAHLKALLPEMDISRLVARCPCLVLFADMQTINTSIADLRSAHHFQTTNQIMPLCLNLRVADSAAKPPLLAIMCHIIIAVLTMHLLSEVHLICDVYISAGGFCVARHMQRT